MLVWLRVGLQRRALLAKGGQKGREKIGALVWHFVLFSSGFFFIVFCFLFYFFIFFIFVAEYLGRDINREGSDFDEESVQDEGFRKTNGGFFFYCVRCSR